MPPDLVILNGRIRMLGAARPVAQALAVRDILTCPANVIGETQVLLTLFNGRMVHRDISFDG